MAAVVGIGGIFIKSRAPEAYQAWYREVLGLDVQSWGGAQLWNERDANGRGPRTYAVWASFAPDTKYFEPSEREFMINFRVDDLDGVLARVAEKGGNVLPKRDETEDGRFGYVLDPEGVLLELFQPAPLL